MVTEALDVICVPPELLMAIDPEEFRFIESEALALMLEVVMPIELPPSIVIASLAFTVRFLVLKLIES